MQKWHSLLKSFDAEMSLYIGSLRASLLGSHPALVIFDLAPLNLQMTALVANQANLAETAS
ncbi:hypothetical protein [Vibrio sp. WXL103]|uniref:hypothetical protein n=1 Tax=Vibrio sp. WXL103 TaxID=3450710 RepID=UPI003EC64E1E